MSTSNLIISRTFFANGVPQDIEEAAFIDGSSPIRAFIVIVLPLSKALIGVMALYYGVGHWNNYFNADLPSPIVPWCRCSWCCAKSWWNSR